MINSFTGEHHFLSNFWPAVVHFEGMAFLSVEHAYVAAKTTDLDIRANIAKVPTAGMVKRIGRGLQLRPDWEVSKINIMGNLVLEKFQSHSNLKEKLLATGEQMLIEGNHWGDTFWGVCAGIGQNNLGRILMIVRTELRGK